MKKVGNWLAVNWTELLFAVAVIVALVFLLGYGLGDLLPGLSQNEVNQVANSSSLRGIFNDPLSAPHKVLQYVTQTISSSAIGIRSASAIIGLFTIGCFYYVLSNWYSKRIALLGTLMLSTSAWFLHIARTGTESSVYLLLFATVAAVTWLKRSRNDWRALTLSGALIISLLYIPGMIWFVLPAGFWQIGRLKEINKHQNTAVLIILCLLLLMLITPLGWAIYQQPDLAKTYLGLPQTMPDPVTVAKDFVMIPVELFVRGPDNAEIWLGRLPLLNIFEGAMFMVGLYTYFKKRALDRTWFVGIVFVVGGLLASLGGPVNIVVILPFVYLVVAGGIALMLQQWFTVFPRNPFAHSVGSLLVTAAVALSAFYGFSHYFIAWPNTPATKQVHQRQL